MARKLSLWLIISLGFLPLTSFGQKQAEHQQLIWFAYFNTWQISGKVWWVNEVQERRFINPDAQHQFLIRTHLHRKLNDHWDVVGGFCLFLQNSQFPEIASSLNVPELRPHIEINHRQKLNRFSIDQRYRLEARFFHNTNEPDTALQDGYSYENLRARYQVKLSFRLCKLDDQRFIKITAGNEVMFNLGKKVVYNFFDQNRLFLGVGADVAPNISFDLGYLNWFQQQKAGNKYFDRDIFRLTLNHRIKSKRLP